MNNEPKLLSTGEVPHPRRLPLPIVWAVALGVVVAMVTASVGAFIAIVPGCTASNLARAGNTAMAETGKVISDTFHLKTTVVHGGTTQTFEASREAQEYVVLEEVVFRQKPWNATGWFWQDKAVDTQHRVRAKYGYDLSTGSLSLEENPVTGQLTVRYPEPQLLSVEVLEEDWTRHDAFFNKVTDQDIKAAQEMLRSSAREELATDPTRLQRAREIMETRLRQSLEGRGIQSPKFEALPPSPPETTPRVEMMR